MLAILLAASPCSILGVFSCKKITLNMSVLMFLFSPQADYYSGAYAGRSALSYDPVQQGIVGYHYTGRDYYGRPYFDSPDAVMGRGILQQMQRRCPFIPSDLIDEKVSNFFFFVFYLFIFFLQV